MLPSELYYKRQKKFKLDPDPKQTDILPCLDQIAALIYSNNALKKSFWKRLFAYAPKNSIKGLYLWGGVGRGKTMLMDIFYDALAIGTKRRVHFHRFMNEIHQLLTQYRHQSSPLDKIAADIAKHTAVLCLDEFHVNDITDAMILHGLFKSLFQQHICLITTSNRIPDDLYKGGLQRDRFIPAIELIKQNCHVVCLNNQIDYRLKTLKNNQTYFYPLNKHTKHSMKSLFNTITTGETWEKHSVLINNRAIKVVLCGEGAIWFEFNELCNTARAQSDYLEIVREYHSIFISNIPQLHEEDNNAVKRFIDLIDIIYDHHVKLILSAASAIVDLYTGKKLRFEFERTSSRLIEMQSEKYLELSHLD